MVSGIVKEEQPDVHAAVPVLCYHHFDKEHCILSSPTVIQTLYTHPQSGCRVLTDQTVESTDRHQDQT